MTAAGSPTGVVTAFIATIESLDLEGALAFLADDVEYDNVPMGAVHGIDQVRATLGPFVARFDEVDWPVSRIAASRCGATTSTWGRSPGRSRRSPDRRAPPA
jgi:limonene-1,2-epoxide hydrolase